MFLALKETDVSLDELHKQEDRFFGLRISVRVGPQTRNTDSGWQVRQYLGTVDASCEVRVVTETKWQGFREKRNRLLTRRSRGQEASFRKL